MLISSYLVVRALNHLIQGESWAAERLRNHAGAQVLIEAGPLAIRLGIDEHGLFHAGDAEHQADVSITLPSDLPVRFLLGRDKLFSSVKLGGSADIAESLAFVLRNLVWDVEADLAAVFGDIPARRLARLGRLLGKSIQDSIRKTAENVAEYAVEDASLVVAHRDITEFCDDVNRTRDDVARLEKRLYRL